MEIRPAELSGKNEALLERECEAFGVADWEPSAAAQDGCSYARYYLLMAFFWHRNVHRRLLWPAISHPATAPDRPPATPRSFLCGHYSRRVTGVSFLRKYEELASSLSLRRYPLSYLDYDDDPSRL